MPTADVLRAEQEAEAKAAPPETPPRDPTGEALLEGLAVSTRELERTGQLQEETTARQLKRSREIERLAEERAEARKKAVPEVEAAERKAEAAIGRVPTPPELPPAPDTRRRAFLEGPTPAKDAIQQFLGALTALAAPMGGLIAGDGLTAMNAINGAMRGWIKGDEDRLEREWSTWQAATDRLLTNYAMQNKQYLDILGSTKLTLDMKYRALERAGMESEDKMMVLAAGEKSDEHIQTALNQRENRLLTFQRTVLDLAVRRDTAMMLDETRRDIAAMQQGKEGAPSDYKTFYAAEKAKGRTNEEIVRDWEDRTNRMTAGKAEAITGQPFTTWTPEEKQFWFEQVAAGNPPPRFAWGDRKSYTQFNREYANWQASRGVTGAQAGAEAASRKALQVRLNTQERMLGAIKIFSSRIDQNIGIIRDLQKKYGLNQFGRLVNQAQNMAIRGVKGSGDLESLRLALISTSNEIAKVESGSLGIAEVSVQQAQIMGKIHDINLNAEDLETVLQTSLTLSQTARKAAEGEVQQTKKEIGELGGVPGAPSTAQTPLKGQKTSRPDGTYQLKTGETVTVKGGVIQ